VKLFHSEAFIMNPLILPALALLVGWGLYAACRSRPLFVVRISEGTPRAVRGQVTRAFLQDIAEIATRHRVRRGEIRGLAAGRRINLEFSSGIPGRCQQQIRNLWGACGWPAAGPTGPRRTA
jgi:hypothetical protein